jgi:hypothetical protein
MLQYVRHENRMAASVVDCTIHTDYASRGRNT